MKEDIKLNNRETSTSFTKFGFDALFLILSVFTATLLLQSLTIKVYGVNSPFWDEWSGFPRFLSAYRSNTLTIHDFFAQHNEHRILTVRVAFLLTFALLGEWNSKANMLMSALLVSGMSATWAYIIRKNNLPFWITLVSILILVSPAQYQNITWGFQFQFYSMVFFTFAGISIVSLSPNLSWLTVIGVSITCFFATFSIASGLLSWAVIGISILFKVILGAHSFRSLFTDKTSVLKILTFGIAVILTIGLYFKDYSSPPGDDFRVKTLQQFLSWLFMALCYPICTNPSRSLFLLFMGLFIVWTPTIFFVSSLLRQRQHARSQSILVLLTGLICFMVLNALIIGYGRGGLDAPMPSRYTTIFSWSSLISLFAIGGLFQSVKLRPYRRTHQLQLVLFAVLILVQLLSHERRALIGFAAMQQNSADRERMNQTVVAYLSNPSPQLLENEPIPFPDPEILQQQLDNLAEVAILPQDVTGSVDPQGWILSGNAWSIGGVLPTTPSPGHMIALGSWSGSDAYTGSITSRPLKVKSHFLIVPLAGYLSLHSGSLIRIETLGSPTQSISFPGANIGTEWYYWTVDVSRFYGQDVRIVAVDDDATHNGWFGFGWPLQLSWIGLLLWYFWNSLEYLLGATIALTWLIPLLWRSTIKKS